MSPPVQQDTVQTDVIICGAGSAGICAALWLARLGVDFRILERRDGALAVAQADGVQCRTVEIFDSFQISEELVREAYHVNELTFWNTDAASGRLTRQSTAPDTPPGISHQPHVILNQARVNQIMLNKVQEYFPSLQVDYNSDVTGVSHDDAETGYPIRVQFTRDGKQQEFKGKYVLVCVIKKINFEFSQILLNLLIPFLRHVMALTARFDGPYPSTWSATPPMPSGE